MTIRSASHGDPHERSNRDEENRSVYDLFRKHGTLQRYKRNSFVYLKGELAGATFYIEQGLIRVCQFTGTGQDVTFFLRKNGDFFGIAEIILNQNRQSNAQCLTDCDIWVLKASIIQEKMHSDPDVNAEVMYAMASRLIYEQRMVELLISKPVSWRLAYVLKQLGAPGDDNLFHIDKVFTQEELSNMIGCSRQTVSELLSAWRAQNIISYSGRSITVHDFDAILDEM